MLPGLHRLLDGARHLLLAGPLRAADAGHRCRQQDVDVGQIGWHE
jgi:hypothetical protein